MRRILDWLTGKYEDYLVRKFSRQFGLDGPEREDGTERRISEHLLHQAYVNKDAIEFKKLKFRSYKPKYPSFPEYPFYRLGLPFGDGDATGRRKAMWFQLEREYVNLVDVLRSSGQRTRPLPGVATRRAAKPPQPKRRRLKRKR